MRKWFHVIISSLLLPVILFVLAGCEKNEPEIDSNIPGIRGEFVTGARVGVEYLCPVHPYYENQFFSNQSGKADPASPEWLATKDYYFNVILKVKALSIPSWMKIYQSYGDYLLKGTPSKGDAGEYNIVLEVSNGIRSVRKSFVLKVDDNDNFTGEFVSVPAGSYSFGTGSSNQTRTINYNYQIMKYEVTNSEYADFLNEELQWKAVFIKGMIQNGVNIKEVSGYINTGDSLDFGKFEQLFISLEGKNHIKYDGGKFLADAGFESYPITGITYYGAMAFALHYRLNLPDTYEWQKAARGNNTSDYAFGLNYGSDISKRANYKGSGDPFEPGPSPVGYFNGKNGTIDSPGPYGTYDMTGNVSEYVIPDYLGYGVVCLGGDWNSILDNTKPDPYTLPLHQELFTWSGVFESYQNLYYISDRLYTHGFRCVKK